MKCQNTTRGNTCRRRAASAAAGWRIRPPRIAIHDRRHGGGITSAVSRHASDSIEWHDGVIRGVIHGPLPNKSNSRRLVRVHGRMIVIKARDALDWLANFRATARLCAPARLQPEPAGTRWGLYVEVYQANLRRDLDIELLCDALQKSGVIVNDRAIWEKHAIRHVDRENPRVEFILRRQTIYGATP